MKKKLLAIILSMLIGISVSSMDFMASAAGDAATLTSATGTATGYSTLQAAINAAADGGVITLNTDVTESLTYTGTAGKTVTINGQGHTVTGVAPTPNSPHDAFALKATGAGVLNLKNITLTGGSVSDTSFYYSDGLYADSAFTGTIGDLGAVIAKGGVREGSIGVDCEDLSSGTVNVTEAIGNSDLSIISDSRGVLNGGSGTVNVHRAIGGDTIDYPGGFGQSYGVYNSDGTVNVDTAVGGSGANSGSYGIFNNGGCVNANSVVSGNVSGSNSQTLAVYVSGGVTNVGTAACGTYSGSSSRGYAVFTEPSTDAVVNVGTVGTTYKASDSTLNIGASAVRALAFNAGSGAYSTLGSVTVAGTGATTLGALPSVSKNGKTGSWYSDKTLKTAFTATTVDSQTTALYSSFYLFTVSGKITGSDGKALAATLQLKNGGVSVGAPITANADGTYAFAGLSVGDGYTIEGSADGYTSGTVGSFNITGSDIASGLDLQLSKIITNDTGTASTGKTDSSTSVTNSTGTGSTPVSNPKTGDRGFPIFPLMALAVVSLSGFGVIKLRKADRKRN